MEKNIKNLEIYQERREKLLAKIENGIVIIPSAEYKNRSNDTEYSFRQNSNFYYLTGFLESNSVLVLHKEDDEYQSTIFLNKKNPELELWSGKRLGEKKACEFLGMGAAYPIEEFDTMLEDILEGQKKIYLSAFHENKITKKVYKTSHHMWQKRKRPTYIPQEIIHVDHIIEQMRLIKDDHEIKIIKKAAEITSKAHKATMAYCSPGKNEKDLEGALNFFFRMNGGSGEAYTSIVAGGENANVLHYVENNDTLTDGDLILIDAGAEKDLYACDVTRTFPINGKFSEPQKEVYQAVLNAQKDTIKKAKPGVSLNYLHECCQKEIIKGLIELNILKGDPGKIFKNGEHRKFFPHGTGHWLGLDVHDQCPYTDENNEEIILQENMYFTVEPGIYIDSEDKSVPEKYRGIGIRIEDDILITKNGNSILTNDIPKEVVEVEEACSKNFADFF